MYHLFVEYRNILDSCILENYVLDHVHSDDQNLSVNCLTASTLWGQNVENIVLYWTNKKTDLLLKIEIGSEFIILTSRLNQLFRVQEKMNTWKNLFSNNRLVDVFFLVFKVWPCLGIKLIRLLGTSFFIILNIQQRRLNHVWDCSDSGLNSWNIFSRAVTRMAPVIAKVALYRPDSNFSQN